MCSAEWPLANAPVAAARRKLQVVGGYKKIEEGAVGGVNKISDSFVDQFLTKDGESIEEAKARLAEEQRARQMKAMVK